MSKKQSNTEIATAKQNSGSPTSGYEDFIRSLKLIGLAVSNAQFQVDRETYFDEKDQEQVIEVKTERTDVDEGSFDISVTLALSVVSKKRSTKVLEITVTYLMHIHSRPPINKEYVERFAAKEVRLLIWPYLREFVTSACAKMYVPPIFLPLPGAETQSGPIISKGRRSR